MAEDTPGQGRVSKSDGAKGENAEDDPVNYIRCRHLAITANGLRVRKPSVGPRLPGGQIAHGATFGGQVAKQVRTMEVVLKAQGVGDLIVLVLLDDAFKGSVDIAWGDEGNEVLAPLAG